MGWRGRAPWILAAVLALVAVAGWQDARETRRKFAGVPEEMNTLASKIDALQREGEDVEIVELLAKAIAGQAPRNGINPPASDVLGVALAKGVKLAPDSCLWKLAEAVKDCRVKGETTAEDQARIDALLEECHARM